MDQPTAERSGEKAKYFKLGAVDTQENGNTHKKSWEAKQRAEISQLRGHHPTLCWKTQGCNSIDRSRNWGLPEEE